MFMVCFFFIHFFFLYLGDFRLMNFLMSCELCVLMFMFMVASKTEGCVSMVIILASVLVMEAAVGISILVKVNRNLKKNKMKKKHFLSF